MTAVPKLWRVLTQALAIATSLCARCDRQDPQQVRLDAPLAARYDPARWEGQRPASSVRAAPTDKPLWCPRPCHPVTHTQK
jgi:hypothetical protein